MGNGYTENLTMQQLEKFTDVDDWKLRLETLAELCHIWLIRSEESHHTATQISYVLWADAARQKLRARAIVVIWMAVWEESTSLNGR